MYGSPALCAYNGDPAEKAECLEGLSRRLDRAANGWGDPHRVRESILAALAGGCAGLHETATRLGLDADVLDWVLAMAAWSRDPRQEVVRRLFAVEHGSDTRDLAFELMADDVAALAADCHHRHPRVDRATARAIGALAARLRAGPKCMLRDLALVLQRIPDADREIVKGFQHLLHDSPSRLEPGMLARAIAIARARIAERDPAAAAPADVTRRRRSDAARHPLPDAASAVDAAPREPLP